MKCPYCHTGIRLDIKKQFVHPDKEYSNTKLGKEFVNGICPECNDLIVLVKSGKITWIDDKWEIDEAQEEIIIYPKIISRMADSRVPIEYRNAFNETNSVLPISPKASAALSRRLLQQILRDKFGINKHDLSKQIDEFINLPNLPSEITGAIDAIRNVGNFAAHPIKYTNTGEIVDVELGESEWILDVLEEIINFAFIREEESKARKTELNNKLIAIGKPPLK